MKIDIFFSAPKKAVRLDVYFHFLFRLKLIKQKEKELNSISNKIYLFVTAPTTLLYKLLIHSYRRFFLLLLV